jgi:hypothetical protein
VVTDMLPSTAFTGKAYTTLCTRIELELLEAIAREHPGRVVIKTTLTAEGDRAVTFKADAPELRDYLHFQLARTRTQRLALQAALAA